LLEAFRYFPMRLRLINLKQRINKL